MALNPPHLNDRRRVKVYELQSTDWLDRGTGFCAGQITSDDDAHIIVQSEDEPSKILLDVPITKSDVYSKQQDTLILWTPPSLGNEVALSFQDPIGCTSLWDFAHDVQRRLSATLPTDMDEDIIDGNHVFQLPETELANLPGIEMAMRNASQTNIGRESLGKYVMATDSAYIGRLVGLVDMAEDLEDLEDLHHLCNIIKMLILLNDNAIIECIVRDDMIHGIVGALEYDPDFPSHKANHRQYLGNNSKFKEVVTFEDEEIRRKIHHTYRLQYLKDVVLARILDDPTFSVLNSLIFFHQVDIVNHIQSNTAILDELFGIFSAVDRNEQRKKDAVLFIQHLCSISKSIQANARAQLFQNFINAGLFMVLNFALSHADVSVRVAGSDILVAFIDHDPAMMRTHIFRAINDKTKPLTETLVDLLLVEHDLGVKTQMADAIKVLLDPTSSSTSLDMLGRTNGEFMAKMRGNNVSGPQADAFIEHFYKNAAKRLFQPLKALEARDDLSTLNAQEASVLEHLIGIHCFFLRAHSYRSKFFTLTESLHGRIAQLLGCKFKQLNLMAIKWFKVCISLNDEYHTRALIAGHLLEGVLVLLEKNIHRENLLNSACLDFFEFIKKDANKALLVHLIETDHQRYTALQHIQTFEELLGKYEAIQAGVTAAPDESSFSTQDIDTPNRGIVNGGQRWQAGIRDLDADEEAYFNTPEEDDEDDVEIALPTPASTRTLTNGSAPVKALVPYVDDDDDENEMEDLMVFSSEPLFQEMMVDDGPIKFDESRPTKSEKLSSSSPDPLPKSPLERPSEKRRREEDTDDALDAMANGTTPLKKRLSLIVDSEDVFDHSRSPSPAGNESTLSSSSSSSSLKRRLSIKRGETTPERSGIHITLKRRSSSSGSDGARVCNTTTKEQSEVVGETLPSTTGDESHDTKS